MLRRVHYKYEPLGLFCAAIRRFEAAHARPSNAAANGATKRKGLSMCGHESSFTQIKPSDAYINLCTGLRRAHFTKQQQQQTKILSGCLCFRNPIHIQLGLCVCTHNRPPPAHYGESLSLCEHRRLIFMCHSPSTHTQTQWARERDAEKRRLNARLEMNYL